MATLQTAHRRPRTQRVPPQPVALQFLRTLAVIQQEIQVTTREGTSLTLSDGLRRAMEAIETCAQSGHKLIFIGNGGSAAIASHQAVDYWKNGGVEAIAFNDASLLTCIGNDYGYDQIFVQPIRRFAKAGDCLMAISSSGQSLNILQGVEAARARGCEVVTFSGFESTNALRSLGLLNFYVPSHTYGVVEVMHLGLLHAMLDELMATKSAKAKTA